VEFDNQVYASPKAALGVQRQSAVIIVHGKERGIVEVAYAKAMPDLDEGPFLKEERKLIDTVAAQIALIIERKQAEDERRKLQDQLRHADRLATIGQLAAGVAHELNEPLGSILGFAQLAGKNPGTSKEAASDLQRIVNAALHAREVVKKLMLFSRQMPTRKELVNLNKVVKEGLYFLESRASKAGVELVKAMAPGLPLIYADQSQLYQVLVNLAVNAVQAMPDGGMLTLRTESRDDRVLLIVEDTGIGMSEEVLGKLFMPFFTTKDINEGTGLGLSVVHGIVTSHGGEIKVNSRVGQGTRFEISLPSAGVRGAGGGDD
jgi:signal transduction histidine kinase